MIHVAMATDAHYLPFCATAMGSLLAVEPARSMTIHLLHDDSVTQERLNQAARWVSSQGGDLVTHGPADERLARVPAVGRFGRVVWLRFLLPELVPQPRVLFLDADTFAVSPIRPLWESPLGGAPLGAVANVVEPAMRPHVHSLGVDHRSFFNSGVLLMDLDAMRSEGDVDRLLTYAAETTQDLVWPDQDTLNVVFSGRWKALPPKWNAMNSLWTWESWAREIFDSDALIDAKEHPAILHFEGPAMCKPWHYLSTHPWRATYRDALARTPWASPGLADRTVATRFITLLPERYWLPAYLKLRRGKV